MAFVTLKYDLCYAKKLEEMNDSMSIRGLVTLGDMRLILNYLEENVTMLENRRLRYYNICYLCGIIMFIIRLSSHRCLPLLYCNIQEYVDFL